LIEVAEEKLEYLKDTAHALRKDLVGMFHASGKGHLGGSLSIVDVMTALYFHIMRVDPGNPKWPDRDRLVLSKGHASATWYAALSAKGFFPRDLLFTDYMKIGGKLQEHSDMNKVPGVEMSSGALGQGLSVGLGMCLAGRLAKKEYRVYVILGDGELQEGQVWEAFMASGHYRADKLTALIDYNKLQVCDTIAKTMELEPLATKIEAFRWHVLEIDGNDMGQVVSALEAAKDNTTDRPTAIICNTIKGKGVSFIENDVHWHSHTFSDEDYQQARKELAAMEDIRGRR
jgi:transketolase